MYVWHNTNIENFKNGREEHHYLNSSTANNYFIILISHALHDMTHRGMKETERPQQSQMHCSANGQSCMSLFTLPSSLIARTALVVLTDVAMVGVEEARSASDEKRR